MEHRYSDRSTADLNIVIYKQNLLVALGVVKNIGKAGVFIESGFSELNMNQPLEIEFFPGDKAAKNRRFKAVVVHRNEQGFGVEIENIAEQLYLLEQSKNPQFQRRSNTHYNARPAPHKTSLGYASL